MTQGELLESLADGGLFEDHLAKSLVVVIYYLWDEHYRPGIAKAVSAVPAQVECTLLGDIRRVRNLIIHKNSVMSESFPTLSFLSQIWNLKPGEIKITSEMVTSLLEQVNALRLTIVDPSPPAHGCKMSDLWQAIVRCGPHHSGLSSRLSDLLLLSSISTGQSGLQPPRKNGRTIRLDVDVQIV